VEVKFEFLILSVVVLGGRAFGGVRREDRASPLRSDSLEARRLDGKATEQLDRQESRQRGEWEKNG
jgi:hypothetical protein